MDKRFLKSSKVREWYKMVNDALEPKKQEILEAANKATIDAMMYGTGFYEFNDTSGD